MPVPVLLMLPRAWAVMLIFGVCTIGLAAMCPVSRRDLVPRDPAFRISINRADPATLCLLPGLGPRLAWGVARHRKVAGPFRSVDDLREVRGIGSRTIQRLAPFVVCSDGSEPHERLRHR